jgi:type IV secretion system protein VirD4
MVDETFSGALGNATEDTEWIASAAYGNLVSGHPQHGPAYRMDELAEGHLVVFCQVPQEALEHTPAVARVLVGCHLDAVFAAKGKVNGRVFFPIDEAALIGRDPALKIARDLGRKSKITLQLYYQSEGQIDEVWTPAGKRAWFDSLSWRTYAGVQNLESARQLSAIMGTFAARAVSRGEGKTRKTFNVISTSQGENTSEHEISRELAKPHELLTGMRDDERITLVRNQPPMRHGAAIAFRRSEMAPLLGETSYRRRHVPDAAE